MMYRNSRADGKEEAALDTLNKELSELTITIK